MGGSRVQARELWVSAGGAQGAAVEAEAGEAVSGRGEQAAEGREAEAGR